MGGGGGSIDDEVTTMEAPGAGAPLCFLIYSCIIYAYHTSPCLKIYRAPLYRTIFYVSVKLMTVLAI